MLPGEPKSRDYLLAIPTFNHRASLSGVVAACKAYVENILVVNDGSTDGTENLMDALDVATVHHVRNLGKGHAIQTAFQYAKAHGYRNLITMDADGQHQAADLPQLISASQQSPGAIIVGVRDMHAKSAGMVPRASLFGRSFSNFWIYVETGKRLADTQSGFRSYPVSDQVFGPCRLGHYDFEIEVLTRSLWKHVPVMQVPIGVVYPKHRISHFNPYADNLRLTVLHTKLTTMRILQLVGAGRIKIKNPDLPKGEVRGTSFLEFVLKICGPRVCYSLAIFPIFFVFISNKTKRNFIKTLHFRLDTPKGSFFTGFPNYWLFGVSLIDRLALRRKNFPGTIRDPSAQDTATLQPGIFVGSHYGDWLVAALGLAGKRKAPLGIVVRGNLTPRFQTAVQRLGPKRVEIIDATDGGPTFVLKVKSIMDRGGIICLLGDRVFAEPKYCLSRPFLGKPALWMTSPYSMARILKAPLYFFTSTKQGFGPRAPYLVEVDTLWDGQSAATDELLLERYIAKLEALVKRDPRHWFNFIDFWHQSVRS